MNEKINTQNNLDLFEFLKYILGCTYISDLRIELYNTRAKLILKLINTNRHSDKQVEDTVDYIYKN